MHVMGVDVCMCLSKSDIHSISYWGGSIDNKRPPSTMDSGRDDNTVTMKAAWWWYNFCFMIGLYYDDVTMSVAMAPCSITYYM